MTVATVRKGDNMSVPYTGVMTATAAVFEECEYGNGIDLTWEAVVDQYMQEHGLTSEADIPDNAFDWVEINEPEYIIGDWEKDEDGVYDHRPRCKGAGYAAILSWLGGAPIVHVVWSETVRGVRAMCSPCCPGQADLDSGEGDIEAYALPPEFNWNGEDY